jgi:NAD(P)-dependent dehydrogenase (short-subunit alcohol dehydrogenase family)
VKIIIVGSTGTVGKAVTQALKNEHDIIHVAHTQGDYRVDITDENSIKKMFNDIGHFDALISTTGQVHFGLLKEFDHEKWQVGLQSKLMGQINLVSHGLKYINKNGSFTLTTGILSDEPIVYGVAASMVNGAINAFVKAAAIEMENGVRINAISPTLIKESAKNYGPFFKGFIPVDAATAAQAYVKSVEGKNTGKIYTVY